MRFAPIVLLLTFLGALPLLGAAPSGYPPPIVVVYPLTLTSTATSSDAGSNIALLLATKLGQLGGITVKPFTPGTERPLYLENAIKESADYYVTGFLTPLGSEVSMISQVVSTHSGSVVYSTTITARTYADAAGQADLLHDAIIRHAGRGLPALDAPPPAPSSSPSSDVSSSGVNLTKALRRHQRTTPAESPAPSQVALASRPRTVVVEVSGDSDSATRTSVGVALSKALAHQGFTGGYVPVAESEVRIHAHDLCSANAGTRVLLATKLTLEHVAPAQPNVLIDVTAYDCAGTVLGRQHVSSPVSGKGGLASALQRAAQSAAEAFAKAGLPAKPAG
jgi:hypothetical protein